MAVTAKCTQLFSLHRNVAKYDLKSKIRPNARGKRSTIIPLEQTLILLAKANNRINKYKDKEKCIE